MSDGVKSGLLQYLLEVSRAPRADRPRTQASRLSVELVENDHEAGVRLIVQADPPGSPITTVTDLGATEALALAKALVAVAHEITKEVPMHPTRKNDEYEEPQRPE